MRGAFDADAVKTVLCKLGTFIVAKTNVQILPRFEEGIELLLFLVPEERKTVGDMHSFCILLDLASKKVLASDAHFFRLTKLEQYCDHMEHILQEIDLSDLLPLFKEGEQRMMEELRLSPLTAVRTRLNVQAITDQLKLPPAT